ncbi:CHAT domain-containing protein [uncultured Lacinutrix sp.]|uniref:CHAT domain-containing protein n=1 Tax=uncultured Lacinutrix sp. TaxID=574032 RepID=UPI002617BE98|nr:CHAT domain-containing protein [uncultured Lacinutrix sp.]
MNNIHKISEQKRKGIIFPFFFVYCIFTSLHLYSQEASKALDSIQSLKVNDSVKTQLYNQLFETYKKQNNYAQLGNDAHELAKRYYRKKFKKETIEYTKIAVKARKKAIPYNAELLKRSTYNVGYFYKKYDSLSKSILWLKKAIAIKDSDFNDGRSFIKIADNYEILGDPFQAVENHLLAFSFLDTIKDRKRILNNHINIAYAYKQIRESSSSKEAIKHLTIADSLIKTHENPNKKSLFAIHTNLGSEYFQGLYKPDTLKAIFHFNKALEYASEIENPDYKRQSYYNLGFSHININIKQAKEYLSKSLSYVKDEHSKKKLIYYGFGETAYTERNYNQALEYYYKSLSFYFKTNTFNKNWFPTKDQLEAVHDKEFLLELLKKITQVYLEQAIQEKDKNFNTLAIKTVKISDRLIDLLMSDNFSYTSRLLWRDLASEIYIMGLEACYKNNNLSDAFYFMEKNKALLLTQEIQKNNTLLPTHILEKEKELKNNLNKLQALSEKTTNNNDSLSLTIYKEKEKLLFFKDSITKKHPNHFTLTALPKILPLSKIQLKQDQVIIQYIMAERKANSIPNAYGLLLSRDQNILFKIDPIDELISSIYEVRKKLNAPFRTIKDIEEYKKTSYYIYKTLFPKETRNLLKNKKVTIIADHVLNFIPFEALVIDEGKGSYLIEESEINYALSLSFSKENSKVLRKSTKDFFGIAPMFFTEDLTTLSQSEKEINSGNQYYSGDLLTKEQATKENVTQAIDQYKIVHFATHADASDTINPWIALRHKKLHHFELNLLKNNAELIILSACNTSLGKVNRGEGVMSLARGFFKSGAHTVIPSLWSTNDKATATITSHFYKNLSEGKTKSEALRTAKLNYLNSNSDAEASPHYWAALVLIGDTGTLLPRTNYTIIIYISITILLLIVFSIFIFKKYKKT